MKFSTQFSRSVMSKLCDSMNCSPPALPVLHHLLELAQTHIHWVSDDIQPSYPLSSPSSPAFNLSQHHDVFTLASSLHQLAKVLEFQLQHHSFHWIQDWFSLGLTDLILLQKNSQESSPTPQFKSINSSVLTFLHSPTLTSIHDHRKNH